MHTHTHTHTRARAHTHTHTHCQCHQSEVVVFKDRVVEVPVEKVVFKDNVQTVTQEKVVEKVVDKVVEVPKPGKKGPYTKDWSSEIAGGSPAFGPEPKSAVAAPGPTITSLTDSVRVAPQHAPVVLHSKVVCMSRSRSCGSTGEELMIKAGSDGNESGLLVPSGAKNELAILQKQLTEAQNAKVTKTPPSSYLAGDAYNDVISPMQEAQVRVQCSRSSDMERPVLSVRKGWAKRQLRRTRLPAATRGTPFLAWRPLRLASAARQVSRLLIHAVSGCCLTSQ